MTQERAAEDIQRVELALTRLFHEVRSTLRDDVALVHPQATPAAYNILAHLVNVGPARAADLAEVFAVDKAAISRHLCQMEALGLIERTPSPADRRALHVTATEQGRRGYLTAKQVRLERLRERLRRWPPQEVGLLADLLEKLDLGGR